MANSKIPRNLPGDAHGSDDINKTLKLAKNDPTVKSALKIEKQPVTADDLSPLHNTIAIGTSGGDQRASENEQKETLKADETQPVKKSGTQKKWIP
ncbi:MAG: hypothetical protein H7Z13_07535 [Ferruginibacter sp.]|nr:hypothetical protein [Ferruginibacter sp.]